MITVQPLTIEEVLSFATEGIEVPAGLIRFIASPRALTINYPIERLRAEGPDGEEKKALESWVLNCIQEQRIRFYAADARLFDN